MGRARRKPISLDIDLSRAKILTIKIPQPEVPVVRRPRYEIVIPDWRPVLLNEVMRSTKPRRIYLERKSHKFIAGVIRDNGVAPAETCRRVSLMIGITKATEEFDRDAPYKVLFDSLVACKALRSDRCSGVEIGPLDFYPAARLTTTIILEDWIP